ncbi:MAG: PHP domain-containing protein [Methanomassiliicoccaceae archaeon]|nr:PHP domain-containing protein [Methanomassiliicoccaceae archaeon]
MEATLLKMTQIIEFKRPDVALTVSSGKTCADMHFHTHYSDSYTQTKDVVRLAVDRGVGVAITDHNQIGGVLDAMEMKSDAFIIPGMEVSTSDGPHILTYFYSWRDLKAFWDNHIREHIR